MNKLIYSTEKHILKDILKPLAGKYYLSLIPEAQKKKIVTALKQFETFKDYADVFFVDSVQLEKNGNKSLLIILSVNHVVLKTGKHIRRENITEWELVGLVNLKKDYGKVLIRPETLADKIEELFYSSEVDFNTDKEFSNKYFVLTTDEKKLSGQITAGFLAAIKKYRGLEIEINGCNLVVRLKKPISPETVITIAQFVNELNNGTN